jgi:hypothetical protein
MIAGFIFSIMMDTTMRISISKLCAGNCCFQWVKRHSFKTEGRVFWTEFGECGTMPFGLKQALSQVSFEVARILLLLLGDSLCWSALKSPTRKCPHCSSKFTTEHFFSCQRFFAQDAGWRIFVGLCRTDSWEDFVDFVMTVLKKWVHETPLFRPAFRLCVQEYENLCIDPVRVAFRWNVL